MTPHQSQSKNPLLGKKMNDIQEEFLMTRRSEETKRGYRRDISRFLDHLELETGTYNEFLHIPIPDMTSKAQAILNKYKKVNEQTNEVLNPATFNRLKFSLSSFFNFLIRQYDYIKNPLFFIQAMPKTEKSKTEALDITETLALLFHFRAKIIENKPSQHRDYLIVLGLFLLALRRKELTNLRWDQINQEGCYIRLIQKGKKEKIIPIPLGYLQLLKKHREQYQFRSDFVFHPIQNNRMKVLNKPISDGYVYSMVVNAATKVIPNRKITPHSFRTTFVTVGLKWREDYFSIMNGTGHSSIRMIRYYDKREELENNFIIKLGKYLEDNGLFDTIDSTQR